MGKINSDFGPYPLRVMSAFLKLLNSHWVTYLYMYTGIYLNIGHLPSISIPTSDMSDKRVSLLVYVLGGKGFGLHEKSTLSLDLSLTSSLGSVTCDRNTYIMVVRSIMDPYRHVFWTRPWKCSIFDFSFLISTPRRNVTKTSQFQLTLRLNSVKCSRAVLRLL